MDTATWLIVLIVILVVAFLAIAIIWGIKAHRNRVAAGREDLVGRTAEVDTPLDPKGIVLIEGERWTAVMESGQAEPQEEVIVTKVEGLKLRVTKNE